MFCGEIVGRWVRIHGPLGMSADVKFNAVNTSDREWLHDHQHTPSLLYKPMLIKMMMR